MVDPGETVAQAAIRETTEETGIETELTRMVGIYSSPRWHNGGDNVVVFAGEPLNHRIAICPDEIADAAYFEVSELPEPTMWWDRQRIADAYDGKKGIARLQDKVWPFEPDVRLADWREILGRGEKPRAQFYWDHFAEIGPEGQKIEVLDSMTKCNTWT